MAHTTDLDILVQQLLSSSSHRVGIDAQKLGQLGVAAAAQPERFQSCIQAALLFIEHTVEQNDCRFEFVGRDLQLGEIGHDGDGLGCAARQ